MNATEEFIQLLNRKDVSRIVPPTLVFALLTAAEEGNEIPLLTAIKTLREKIAVLDNIEIRFKEIVGKIKKDYDVGIIAIKANARKNKLKKLQEQEDIQEKEIEEALLKSLLKT